MNNTNITTNADRQAAKKLIAKINANAQQVILEHGFLGHVESSHVNVTNTKLLDNMLFRGKKRGDTVFNSKEIATQCLKEVLTGKAYNIATFARTAKPGETRTYYWQTFDENQDDDEPAMIGHGFIGEKNPKGDGIDISKPIRAIQTNMAAVIITRDPKAEDGWKITTAFPISRVEPRMTEYERADLNIQTIPDFDFEPVLHATESYQHASPIQRVLLDYNNIDRKTMTAIPVQYVPRENGREEQIIIPMPPGRYTGHRVIITGDERAAASRTGSFPLPDIIESTTSYLTQKVNDQITQFEIDRRARKRSASRNTDDMYITQAQTENPANQTKESPNGP